MPRNLPVTTFENRLRFGRIMTMSLWPHFFSPPCISERWQTVRVLHGARRWCRHADGTDCSTRLCLSITRTAQQLQYAFHLALFLLRTAHHQSIDGKYSRGRRWLSQLEKVLYELIKSKCLYLFSCMVHWSLSDELSWLTFSAVYNK